MGPRDHVTILMPCIDQKESFLAAALDSVQRQTSPDWRVLIITGPDIPTVVEKQVASRGDQRIGRVVSEGVGMGGALNTGIRAAESDYVCILMSDDALAASAVATVRSYARRHPRIDFFYSSRRYMDGQGRLQGGVMKSVRRVRLKDFSTRGSPVKHLLCWRRAKGLDVGGMDERFSVHGCDDFDFPWAMAEAGARFMRIPRCLYYYRTHQDYPRLTTHVPLQQQVDTTSAIFLKHRVLESDTSTYVRQALGSYLCRDAVASYREGKPIQASVSCFGEFTPDRVADFMSRQYKERHFFPHRTYFIPKGGPDGLTLARRMCGVSDPSRLHEIVLFAAPPAVDAVPEWLFFDDDLVWHQQQFGKKGQVATANVVRDGRRMFGMVYISDLVQRVSRQRDYKTRVDNVFQGWSRMLINSLLVFAIENGVETFWSPTAELALTHTDRTRPPDGRLFRRVYDDHLREVLDADRRGKWWRIDVQRNAHRAVLPAKRREVVDAGKIICICHDIERGFGHTQSDPDFAQAVEAPARAALGAMLDVEERAGIRCTYHLLGTLFNELRASIESRGHAVAFHSFDHDVPSRTRLGGMMSGLSQRAARGRLASRPLQQCRSLDYRIKGYRPAQSRLPADLSDARLSAYNFEWLASSRLSLQRTTPGLENGIVKIPIHLDDHDLYTGKRTFDEWSRAAIALVRQNDFTAISLHDCYAGWWLKGYAEFLQSMRHMGTFLTFDEVAARVFLSNAS